MTYIIAYKVVAWLGRCTCNCPTKVTKRQGLCRSLEIVSRIEDVTCNTDKSKSSKVLRWTAQLHKTSCRQTTLQNDSIDLNVLCRQHARRTYNTNRNV